MQGINLLSCCFTVQRKFNLRFEPESAGSGRGKRSSNSHFWEKVSLLQISGEWFCRGWKGGRWIGRSFALGSLVLHHSGIYPIPSEDQSMSHATVNETRSWCSPNVTLARRASDLLASVLPTAPAIHVPPSKHTYGHIGQVYFVWWEGANHLDSLKNFSWWPWWKDQAAAKEHVGRLFA